MGGRQLCLDDDRAASLQLVDDHLRRLESEAAKGLSEFACEGDLPAAPYRLRAFIAVSSRRTRMARRMALGPHIARHSELAVGLVRQPWFARALIAFVGHDGVSR